MSPTAIAEESTPHHMRPISFADHVATWLFWRNANSPEISDNTGEEIATAVETAMEAMPIATALDARACADVIVAMVEDCINPEIIAVYANKLAVAVGTGGCPDGTLNPA